MALTRFTLRQIETFVVVADLHSFSGAGERVGLTAQAVSQLIAELESNVGFRLFDRTPRGMTLTQGGEALLRDARGMFSLLGKAAERARRAAKGQTGRLDIGLYGSGVFGVVPQLLARFREAFQGSPTLCPSHRART